MTYCEIRKFVEVNEQKKLEIVRVGLYEHDTKKKKQIE